MSLEPRPQEARPEMARDRWVLIRDVLVFQAKMVLEGIRDLLLPPTTLVAVVIGLVAGGERRGRFFEAVLRAALRFDRWLNLFGALPEAERLERGRAMTSGEGVDSYFTRIEEAILEQHRRGRMTASAKAKIDRWLDTIEQVAGRRPS